MKHKHTLLKIYILRSRNAAHGSRYCYVKSSLNGNVLKAVGRTTGPTHKLAMCAFIAWVILRKDLSVAGVITSL